MTSNKVLIGQIIYVIVSTAAFIFKIFYVVKDAAAGGLDASVRDIDIVFSVVVTGSSFCIIVIYAVLFHKFLGLIKSNNGFLDFMRCQIVFFFTFLIILMSIKSVSLIAIPIEFDVLIDHTTGNASDTLTKSQIGWIQF